MLGLLEWGDGPLIDLLQKQAARIEALEAQLQVLHQVVALTVGRCDVLSLRALEIASGGTGGDAYALEKEVLEREVMKAYLKFLNEIQDKGFQAWLDEWRPVGLGD